MSERQKEPSAPGFDGAQTLRDSDPGAMFGLTAPATVDPEEAETELQLGRRAGPSSEVAIDPEVAVDPEDADTEEAITLDDVAGEAETRQLSPAEAARQVAQARLSGSVELSGEEAEAAYRLALEQPTLDEPSVPTAEVDPGDLRRVSLECRMCGVKVARPAARRFGKPEGAGYRCHRCQNVFCADHVVRVSGLLQTLLSGARFSCQLCLPDNAPPAPEGSPEP